MLVLAVFTSPYMRFQEGHVLHGLVANVTQQIVLQ